MAGQWKDIISGSADQSNVFNVCPWLTRATLDAIGEGTSDVPSTTASGNSLVGRPAAFDYNFGAMDNNENALARVYGNMLFVLLIHIFVCANLIRPQVRHVR